jgi:hypothetical protein
MTMTAEDLRELRALDAKIRLLLPPEYQDRFETVEPVSMRSAPIKYAADGRVAWDEMWGSFCDLAMAGGPPHKGTLLEPGEAAAIETQRDRYEDVVSEICRGITLATDLCAYPADELGWVRVVCLSEVMTSWLLRAITMENVAVFARGDAIFLPAGPDYEIEKEIKNVVTVISKTAHYWLGHIPPGQKRVIAELFDEMSAVSPLIQPLVAGQGARWRGLEYSSVRAAIWMMRNLVVANVLSRREGTTVFVPLNPAADPSGHIVGEAVRRLNRLAAARGVLQSAVIPAP